MRERYRQLLDDTMELSGWATRSVPDFLVQGNADNMQNIRIVCALARRGETVFVTAEMMNVLLAAERTMPERPFQLEDLPWPAAHVFLETPLHGVFRLAEGEEVALAAVSWAQGMLPDADLTPDDSPDTMGVGAVSWMCSRQGQPNWLPGLCTRWKSGWPPTGEGEHAAMARVNRFLACLWLMLGQRIAVRRQQRLPRPARRSLDRDRPTQPIPDITVIELRRPTSDDRAPETNEPVEWSHRWIVGGHWREQWYPSKGEHHPVWVAPYVKGPDDKPLIRKDRIHAWVR